MKGSSLAFALLASLALLLPAVARADRSTVPDDATGRYSPFAFGAGTDVDHVDLQTGKPEVAIPIAVLAGRGGFGFTSNVRYSGRHLWETEYLPPTDSSPAAEINVYPTGIIAGGQGWFTPGAWSTVPLYWLQAAFITQDYFGCVGDCTPSEHYLASQKVVLRYTLTLPDGSQHEFRQAEFNNGKLDGEYYQCMADVERQLDEGRRWRTTNGTHMELDHHDGSNAVVILPGGTRIVFPTDVQKNLDDVLCAGKMPTYRIPSPSRAAYMEDRNGNRVSFAYSPSSVVVTDADGRTAAFEYTSHPAHYDDGRDEEMTNFRLDATAIHVTGPGGAGTLDYSLAWSKRYFDIAKILGGNFLPDAKNFTYWVLDSVTGPDGLAHKLTYAADWGAGPDGATPISDGRLVRIDYPSGGSSSFDYYDPCEAAGAPSCGLTPRADYYYVAPYPCENSPITGCVDPYQGNFVSAWEQRLNWRRVRTRTTSDGLGHAYAARFDVSADFTPIPNTDAIHHCWLGGGCANLVVKVTDDTSIVETKFFLGQVASTVVRDPVSLAEISRTTMSGWEGEKGSGVDYPDGFNARPTIKSTTVGGFTSIETVTYDRSAGMISGVAHTRGNVVRRVTSVGGSVLRVEETDYATDAGSIAAGLFSLPLEERVIDASGAVLSRKRTRYDESPLEPSGAPNLDAPSGARGNVTSVTEFVDANGATGPVVSETAYYDTGDIRSVTDARGNATTFDRTFGACAPGATHAVRATNALGFVEVTTVDCASHKTLSATDANGARTCTQYDALGRVVEVAGPGDSLSAIANAIRDPGCATGGAAGATTRVTYADLGSPGKQRTIVATKDGSSDGHVRASWYDGLGRAVQTCSEVDPATNQGGAEVCNVTTLDAAGRPTRKYVGFYRGARGVDVAAPPAGTQYTAHAYDPMGRVTSTQLMRDDAGVLPATRVAYGAAEDGSSLLTLTTDARGNLTKSYTDALGRVVAVARAGCMAQDGFCTTRSTFDAAGRLLSLVDPAGNSIAYAYDGLGRKTEMRDPDMGHFAYAYDANGNMTSQTDAKGQVVNIAYDQLNRVALKDLPPAGPGEEDVVFYYDGNLPSDCYSCDDHDDATQDFCETKTLTCVHHAH